jgi:hypothetical protein
MSFGGDDTPSAPSYPPVPPKEELMDVIDYISGVQAITVIGPDGKKKRAIERLPFTPEQQRLHDEAGDLMDKAIVEMKKLNTYNPAEVVDFAPFINVMNSLNQESLNDIAELSKLPDFNQYVSDFKAMGNEIIQQEFKKAEAENMAYLANRGYADSSAEIAMRQGLATEKANALRQNDINSNVYGQQLKAMDQANRRNEFSFREEGRLGQLQRAQMEHQLKVDQFNQMNTQRQQALQNQYGLFSTGAKIRGDDISKAMATKAPELANTIFQQNSMDNLNRYNAEINRINGQYQNQLASYQNQRPSFGESLLNTGLTLGTASMFANPGSVASKLGSRLFGV